jgi:hypothetical protein
MVSLQICHGAMVPWFVSLNLPKPPWTMWTYDIGWYMSYDYICLSLSVWIALAAWV